MLEPFSWEVHGLVGVLEIAGEPSTRLDGLVGFVGPRQVQNLGAGKAAKARWPGKESNICAPPNAH